MTPTVYVCVEENYTRYDEEESDSAPVRRVFYYETDAIAYCRYTRCRYHEIKVEDRYEKQT